MTCDLPSILRSVGFDEKETPLYLFGLEVGSAPASAYAQGAGLNRITAYNTLENLVRRGIFTMERKVRGKWYAPIPPGALALEARQNVEQLERVLPELASLRGAAFLRPAVRFFEGWEGIRHVYDDTLTAKTELLNFANSAEVRRFWPGYDEEYVGQRVKRRIHLRGIAPDDAAGRKVHGEDRGRLREIRLVPAKDFDFTNEINIYDHKVAICTFGHSLSASSFGAARDMFGVIIESKEVAETQRQVFEMAWRYAAKIKR